MSTNDTDWNNDGGAAEEELAGEEQWRRDRYEREKHLQENLVIKNENQSWKQKQLPKY